LREKDGLSAIKPNLESAVLAGSHEFRRAQLTDGFMSYFLPLFLMASK
jgi:hypothetical protein